MARSTGLTRWGYDKLLRAMALAADAIVSATAIVGDDLSSLTLLELAGDPNIRGRGSRILVTNGKIAAYRM